MVLISVADTGYGVPEDAQQKIFTKMFRADNARTKDPNGTGLGLYIIKATVEQTGGKIWFESKENKGSTFSVSLPLEGMKKKEGSKRLE
jgi:two-component system sensor histidine kinase VicK